MKKVPPFQVPEEALNEFEKMAKSEGKTFAQAARAALQEYLERRGVQADFSVGKWGGNRRAKADDQETSS